MRKSFVLSAAAMLSIVSFGLGHASSASALERISAPAEEQSEAGGSSAIVLIVGLAAVIAALAALSGGGEDDRPVSP